MAQKEIEIIDIVDSCIEIIDINDSCLSSDRKGTPLRPVFCLKNRNDITKFEEREECFILDFDPYIDLAPLLKSPSAKDVDDADLRVVAEKGQVACRDFPHPRYICAKYPFEKTPHHDHCELCYCYVCDRSAPCLEWTGPVGHCHAMNNRPWSLLKETRLGKTL